MYQLNLQGLSQGLVSGPVDATYFALPHSLGLCFLQKYYQN